MSLAFANSFSSAYTDCSFIYETDKLKISDLNGEFNVLVIDTGKFTCHLNFPKIKRHVSFTFADVNDAVFEILQLVKMARLFRHLLRLFKTVNGAYTGLVTLDNDWKIHLDIHPSNRVNENVIGQIQNRATGYFWSSNFGCVGGFKNIGHITHHILAFWPVA